MIIVLLTIIMTIIISDFMLTLLASPPATQHCKDNTKLFIIRARHRPQLVILGCGDTGAADGCGVKEQRTSRSVVGQ